jgi:hypothetical protein
LIFEFRTLELKYLYGAQKKKNGAGELNLKKQGTLSNYLDTTVSVPVSTQVPLMNNDLQLLSVIRPRKEIASFLNSQMNSV